MPSNRLIDDDLQYCTTDDVERYVRNKSFDASTDPTQSQVKQMIREASEQVDSYTGISWRTRQVSDRELPVEMDHTLDSAFERKRRLRTPHGFLTTIHHWAQVFLPKQRVKEIDPEEGDQVVVLKAKTTEDITEDGGERAEDSQWYLDGRKGILYIDPTEFRVGPVSGAGMIQDPKVRVTFRYGKTSEDTDGNNVPDDLPLDVRTATAKLVAADIIDTDQYGAVLSSGPENTPDQSTASSRLRDQVWDRHLPSYRDSRVRI